MMIEIEALDTLFFRDARPFSAGAETLANGMFPPSPSVLYGALRSIYFANHPDKLSAAGTAHDPTSDIRLTGVYFKYGQDLFLPLPRDLVKKSQVTEREKEEEQKQYLYTVSRLKMMKTPNTGLVSNTPLPDYLLKFPPRFEITEHSQENLKQAGIPARIIRTVVNHLEQIPGTFTTEQEFLDAVAEWIGTEVPEEYRLSLLKYTRNTLVEELPEGMLNLSALQAYLQGRRSAFSARCMADWITTELKIGIARDAQTHSSQENALYRLDMRRLAKQLPYDQHRGKGGLQFNTIRIVVTVTLPENLPEDQFVPSGGHGYIKLGGEGKGAYFRKLDQPEIRLPQPSIQGDVFTLYLATPAIFAQGWKPSWVDSGAYNGLKLRLLAAAVGQYQPIGGFDMQKRIPKPLQRAVPAGSVYYFRLENGTMDEVLASFHGKSIADDEEDQQQGFGLTYVGNPVNEEAA